MTPFRDREKRLAALEAEAQTRAALRGERCPVCRRAPPPAQFFADLVHVYGAAPAGCVWCAVEAEYAEEGTRNDE